MSYDWLAPSRAQFSRLSAQLPHALLVTGEPGMGKHILAMEMVASLLCDETQLNQGFRQACGRCKNCIMFESGNHPDFHYVSSERHVDSGKSDESAHLEYAERYLEAFEKRGKRKPRKVISVDQIRALIDNFSLSNHSASYKVALIEPAEAMNISASNALLKLLEEPSPDSILMLVCNDTSRLPMTVRSRCIALSIDAPTITQVMSWLKSQGVNESNARKALAICGGSPLIALAYSHSEETVNFETLLVTMAAILNEDAGAIESREILVKLGAPAVLLSWLQMVINWLINAVQCRAYQGEAPWQAYNRAFAKLSRKLKPASLPALFQLYDDLLLMKKQDVDVVNPAMLLDKWLIAFAQRLG